MITAVNILALDGHGAIYLMSVKQRCVGLIVVFEASSKQKNYSNPNPKNEWERTTFSSAPIQLLP